MLALGGRCPETESRSTSPLADALDPTRSHDPELFGDSLTRAPDEPSPASGSGDGRRPQAERRVERVQRACEAIGIPCGLASPSARHRHQARPSTSSAAPPTPGRGPAWATRRARVSERRLQSPPAARAAVDAWTTRAASASGRGEPAARPRAGACARLLALAGPPRVLAAPAAGGRRLDPTRDGGYTARSPGETALLISAGTIRRATGSMRRGCPRGLRPGEVPPGRPAVGVSVPPARLVRSRRSA